MISELRPDQALSVALALPTLKTVFSLPSGSKKS